MMRYEAPANGAGSAVAQLMLVLTLCILWLLGYAGLSAETRAPWTDKKEHHRAKAPAHQDLDRSHLAGGKAP